MPRAAIALLALATLAAGQESERRLTVDVRVTEGDEALWRRALPGGEADGLLAGWGLRLQDAAGRTIDLPPSTACDHDPYCRAWSPSGVDCLDLFAHGHPQWDRRYTCYADSRTLFLGDERRLIDLAVPPEAVRASLTFYARDDELRRIVWPPADGSRLEMRLGPAENFRLAVAVELIAGPGGRPRDVRLDYCRTTGGDSGRRRERLLAGGKPTCRFVAREDPGR